MKKLVAVLGVALLLGMGLSGCGSSNKSLAPKGNNIAAPSEYSAALWDQILGTDTEPTAADYAKLDDPANSDLGADASIVAQIGREILTATESGVGRAKYSDYFADTSTDFACQNVSIVAASAMNLPVSQGKATTQYAKILIAWKGTCNPVDPIQAAGEPSIGYVYAKKSPTWIPVHEWEIPGSSIAGGTDAEGQVIPATYELKQFESCADPTNTDIEDRIVVVNAFELMCQAAKADGVNLTVKDGFRTPAQQADLYQSAVKYYGSEAAARQWVAFSDGNVCASRHCSGTALDTTVDVNALAWLSKVVGCTSSSGYRASTSCNSGETVVTQVQRYGFSQPTTAIPQYLEYVLPLDDGSDASACQPDSTKTVPEMIALIFRCRLSAASIAGTTQKTTVAEAEVVAKCESGFSASTKALGGRWADSAYPLTGEMYTQAGVFMLSDSVAQRYVPGGEASILDPVANINGAASLWLAGQSWGPWPCATGENTPFETGPVLPQFGGPALPDWAYTY